MYYRFRQWLLSVIFAVLAVSPASAVVMRDSNVTLGTSDSFVTTANTFTAPRTITVPFSNAATSPITIIDSAFAINGANTLTIAIQPGDSINNTTSVVVTSSGANITLTAIPNGGWYAGVNSAAPASGGGAISGTLTPNNITIGATSTTVRDSSASSVGYLNSPFGINYAGNINFGAGTAGSAANRTLNSQVTASGICSDVNTCYLNYLEMQDGVDASTAANGLTGWYFHDIVGATSKKGRVAGAFETGIDAIPATAGLNYVGLEAFAHASVNLGGASVFAFNPIAQLNTTAVVGQLIVDEHDGRALAGASMGDFIFQQNVILGTHAQNATRTNVSYATTSQSNSTPMFDALFQDGTYTGWPSSAANTSVFRCYPHAGAGSCPSIGNGIDLRKYSGISGIAFASPGFAVDGAGNMTVTSCAGCGAGGGAATPADYVSSSWYQPNHGLQAQAASTAVTANLIYCIFGGVRSTVTVKAFGAKIATASAGNMSLAVYSVSGATLTLVDNTGFATSTGTITNISATVNNTTDTLSPGTLYAWCEQFSATPTMAPYGVTGAGALSFIGSGASGSLGATLTNGKSIAQTFGTWPATITLSGMADLTTTATPQFAFQVN